MKLQSSELDGGIRLIKLIGALDMTGTYSVEIAFVRQCDGDNVHVIVDLSKVNYLSSIGIPMLINTAKAVAGRGGKLVLLSPQQNVSDVLDIVGIQQIIPIYIDLEAAKASLNSHIDSQ
jgi:anti-sigma B factor antagonist